MQTLAVACGGAVSFEGLGDVKFPAVGGHGNHDKNNPVEPAWESSQGERWRTVVAGSDAKIGIVLTFWIASENSASPFDIDGRGLENEGMAVSVLFHENSAFVGV